MSSNEKKKANYIGRKDELNLLNSILEEVRSGNGKLVLVGGEAGIGKTRMIEEMKGLSNFKDFNFLNGRCLYFKDTDIYLPFKEMFNQSRSILKNIEDRSPFPPRMNNRDNDPISLDSEDFVPMSLIPAEIDPLYDEREQEMKIGGLLEFDKLSDFIFNLAEKGPLCLFIDDLHWADPPSIKLLQYLSQKIGDHPILIICTYRPEDLFLGEDTPHPLADPLKRMSSDKLYVPIELKRLTNVETEYLLRNILEIEKVPKTFSKMIFSRTNGNPFFIEEVVYSLLERKVIDPGEPDWHKNIDPDTISLPSTLKDIILRRMHWLNANSISVIRFASVSSGTNITFEIIKEALRIPEEDVLESLEELVTSKFLQEMDDEESYEFENPVIQEIIYSELNHSRRRFLHTKMAKVLEDRGKQNPAFWGNIGMHYYKGKDFESALQYLIKASSYYHRISPHKALEYLHMVLFCIEKLPQSDSVKEQNLDVMLEISTLCLQIWDWERAIEFADKALNLATALRKTKSSLRAKKNMGEVYRLRGDLDKALGIFQDIVSSPNDEDPEILASSYMGIGYINWRKGEFPRALEMFSKSLQYAKIENNLNTIGSLYINIGNVFNHRGDMEKALDYYSRGVRHLESVGNMIEASRGYSNMGAILFQLGNLEESEEKLLLSIEKAKEQSGLEPWGPLVLMIKLRALQERFNEADEAYERISYELKWKDYKIAQAIMLLYYGFSKMAEGKFDESETALVRTITLLEAMGIPYDLARAKHYLGDLYIRANKFDEARTYLNEAHQIFKSIGAKKLSDEVREMLLGLRDGDGFI